MGPTEHGKCWLVQEFAEQHYTDSFILTLLPRHEHRCVQYKFLSLHTLLNRTCQAQKYCAYSKQFGLKGNGRPDLSFFLLHGKKQMGPTNLIFHTLSFVLYSIYMFLVSVCVSTSWCMQLMRISGRCSLCRSMHGTVGAHHPRFLAIACAVQSTPMPQLLSHLDKTLYNELRRSCCTCCECEGCQAPADENQSCH